MKKEKKARKSIAIKLSHLAKIILKNVRKNSLTIVFGIILNVINPSSNTMPMVQNKNDSCYIGKSKVISSVNSHQRISILGISIYEEESHTQFTKEKL